MNEPDAPSVFFITGVMAVGKSTVAQLLAERFPRSAHVRGDVFRRMVVSGRVEPPGTQTPEAAAQLRLRYELGAMTADRYCKAGYTVVLQDIVLGTLLAEYVAMITARPLHVIVLDAQPDIIATREEGRPKTGYRDRWTIDELRRVLQDATPRLGLWLDTSELSPAETVETILRRREEALISC